MRTIAKGGCSGRPWLWPSAPDLASVHAGVECRTMQRSPHEAEQALAVERNTPHAILASRVRQQWVTSVVTVTSVDSAATATKTKTKKPQRRRIPRVRRSCRETLRAFRRVNLKAPEVGKTDLEGLKWFRSVEHFGPLAGHFSNRTLQGTSRPELLTGSC